MTTINVTQARDKIYHLLKEVSETHKPITITSKSGHAVLIAEEDWNSICESIHLSSIPGMSLSIKDGMGESLSQCSKKLNWSE